MAHTHTNSVVTSTTVNHYHAIGGSESSGLTNCGNPDPEAGYSHRHTMINTLGNSHSHSVTLSFGSAALGSPNWWEHVHAIALVSMGNGGAAHSHGISVNVSPEGCFFSACRSPSINRHIHGTTGYSYNNGGAPHTHTLPTGNTGNANPAGTPENHTHAFSITFDVGDNHTHTVNGTINNANCYYGYSHAHAMPTVDANAHAHSSSGTSGSGGEATGVSIPVAMHHYSQMTRIHRG